ncbi:MAG: hypothetical protein HUN04_02320 [Desulfobacter sp.]|nr:MAG: hypothetical protein HUN04_02320 [Desulfobacter sp.]
MKSRNRLKSALALCIGIFTCLFISGCMFNSGTASPAGSAPPPEEKSAEASQKPTAIYHDFEDVLVPVEMRVVKGRTMIVSTPGFRSGILTLKGRVESNSLYNFFSNNMEKDNWQVFSRIKSPETTIMVYQKTARCAVITIRDEQIYTYVEVSVAPLVSGSNSIQKSDNLTY